MSALQDVAVQACQRAQDVKTGLQDRYGQSGLMPAILHVWRGGQRVAEVWIDEPIARREMVLRTALLGFSADAAVMVAEGLEMNTARDPRTGRKWANSEAVASYMQAHGEDSISRPALVTAAANAAGDTYGGVVPYGVVVGTLYYDHASWTVNCARSEVAEAMLHAQHGSAYTTAVRANAPDLAHLDYASALAVTDKHTVDYLRSCFEVWVGLGADVAYPAQA